MDGKGFEIDLIILYRNASWIKKCMKSEKVNIPN
jgi:hypothetical protein